VFSVDVTDDNKCIASGGDDKQVKVWDVQAKKEIASYTDLGSINSLHFLPGSHIVAFGSAKDCVYLWNPGKGEPFRSLSFRIKEK
jgi:WD40 repeat protein